MNKYPDKTSILLGVAMMAVVLFVSGGVAAPEPSPPTENTTSFIVQGTSVDAVMAAVERVGGTVTHELGIINAVAVAITADQRAKLGGSGGSFRTYGNHEAQLSAKGGKGGGSRKLTVETFYTTHLGADALHLEGVNGSGVTIAVLDSGVFGDNGLTKNFGGSDRILASYNALTDQVGGGNSLDEDAFGHGSHVASVAVSSRQTASGAFNGMAPGADLVVINAFNETGSSTYADVIRGIDWAVTNKDAYGIRVLNCSFSAEPQSYYWDDPLNQAVMAAWRAGIVVVASAGNRGPSAMTIGVPGNVPYVVTVGAMTDNYTPEDPTDDILASFSSAGPTVEGFVKPEMVAPGGHVKGLMKNTAQIAQDHPEFHDGGYYMNLSGTSQATAFVSGIVALMLQESPQLNPDEFKYRLM
jgi:serine protease AprX